MRNHESAPASSLPEVSESVDELNELFNQPSATNEQRQANQLDHEQPANYEEPKSSNFYEGTAKVIRFSSERAVRVLEALSEGAADRKASREEMVDKAKGAIRRIGRSALSRGAAVLNRTTESVKISYEFTKDTMAIGRNKIGELAEEARNRTAERRERREAQRERTAAESTEADYAEKYEQPRNEEQEDVGLDIFEPEENTKETRADRKERRRAKTLELCAKARERKKQRQEFLRSIMTKAPEKTGNLYRTAKSRIKGLGRAALKVAKRAMAAGSAAAQAGAAAWSASK